MISSGASAADMDNQFPWERYHCPGKGYYYHNVQTKTKQWERLEGFFDITTLAAAFAAAQSSGAFAGGGASAVAPEAAAAPFGTGAPAAPAAAAAPVSRFWGHGAAATLASGRGAAAGAAALPHEDHRDEWQKYFSDTQQTDYFYNSRTQQTQWESPWAAPSAYTAAPLVAGEF
jgi:hypothetical protein